MLPKCKRCKQVKFQDKNKYSVSENKLPHTCRDHSKSDKNEANCSFSLK